MNAQIKAVGFLSVSTDRISALKFLGVRFDDEAVIDGTHPHLIVLIKLKLNKKIFSNSRLYQSEKWKLNSLKIHFTKLVIT